jgi:hypothetical protein
MSAIDSAVVAMHPCRFIATLLLPDIGIGNVAHSLEVILYPSEFVSKAQLSHWGTPSF